MTGAPTPGPAEEHVTHTPTVPPEALARTAGTAAVEPSTRTVHVGVLSPATGGFFFGDILAGVVQEVARAGGRVTLIQTLDAGQSSDAFTPLREERTLPVGWEHIDGFVSIAWATTDGYLQRAREAGKPVVQASNDTGEVDAAAVVADNAGGIRASVAHLVGHGHRRIAFVGNVEQSDIRERHEAYEAAMRAHGLTPMPLVTTQDQVETGGRGAAPALLALDPLPTAVVTGTDRVAMGLIPALAEAGLSVPGDVAVVGFDDIEAGWYHAPPLTTVRQRFDDLGGLAATLLLAELRGEDVPHKRHVTPAELVVRGSCGCTPSAESGSPEVLVQADAVVRALAPLLGLDAAGRFDPAAPDGDVSLTEVDRALAETFARLSTATQSPEVVDGLAQELVRRLGSAAAQARLRDPGRADLLERSVGRITAVVSRLHMQRAHAHVTRLSVSLGAQYDVGMTLLGRADGDPAALRWLAPVGVERGCLGLWSGEPGASLLVVSGVHAPDGTLDGLLGSTRRVEEFPPPELVDAADAAAGRVVYVIPVRGSTGDHGLLALVGEVDVDNARGRASRDHWAALLGAALRERRLLEEVRHSEERYAVATRAANDGLWEWSLGTDEVYLSDRCRDLLAIPPGEAPRPAMLTDRMHPADREEVRAVLARAIAHPDVPVHAECRIQLPDGGLRWVSVRALGAAAPDGEVGVLVGSIADIGPHKQLEEQLRRAALYDTVTGLPNRRLFLDRLAHAMELPRRRPEAEFAVLFLDLDGFKLINDSLGHLMGDELLQVVGERLRTELRSLDTAARFGGDEFALLLADPVPDDLLLVANRIQRRIAEPIHLGDQDVTVTASIGIASSATEYFDAEDVLRDADIAMYRAKETERGSTCVFDPTMHERALDRLRTRTALALALEDRQFVVHYQPIVDLDDPTVGRFEALVRWQHPERGLLGPHEFLPSMEGNATIVALGQQVIEQVCEDIARWRRTTGRDVTVSVNLSHREFWAPDLLPVLRSALERNGVPGTCLAGEITESVIMTEPDAARAIMTALHDIGMRLHIDDFGTGHSSLHLLRTFPVDALKIDGSFVRELDVAQTAALVRSIVAMGHALGLGVVAECVETVHQADQLRAMGCTTAQGWLYARALSPEDAGRVVGTRLAAHPEA